MAVQSSDLSTVQFKTLRAIQRFMDEKGFPPTLVNLLKFCRRLRRAYMRILNP